MDYMREGLCNIQSINQYSKKQNHNKKQQYNKRTVEYLNTLLLVIIIKELFFET